MITARSSSRHSGVHTIPVRFLSGSGPGIGLSRIPVWALLLALVLIPVLALPSPCPAARHALLIGISNYSASGMDLDGPANDARAMAGLLTTRYGFPEANVTTLLNRQATRQAILQDLEALERDSRAGDLVFLFFSCHGTSAYDPNIQGQSRDFNRFTGALVPADFESASSVDETIRRLLIGRRDLRPFLSRMDRDRQVVAVVDACFSEMTLRSISGRRAAGMGAKFTPLDWRSMSGYRTKAGTASGGATAAVDVMGDDLVADPPDTGAGSYGSETIRDPAYPYRNLIYLSASSRREAAVDINRKLIRMGYKTFDGRPHGAMTDALIQGLSGPADTNNDGAVSYRELIIHTRKTVLERFPHTPQIMYHRDNPGAIDRPFLAKSPVLVQAGPAAAPTTGSAAQGGTARPSLRASEKLRVRPLDLSPELERAIAALAGVELVDADYDLQVVSQSGRIHILLAGGHPVADFPAAERNRVLTRLRHQVRVRHLIDLEYRDQRFNVSLELIGQPGVLISGERIGFRIISEKRAHLLLLNIDPAGHVSVVYPYHEEETVPVDGGRALDLPNIGRVGPPLGTEYLKIFAFLQPPRGLERFRGAAFPPTDPAFGELMQLLEGARGQASAGGLTVFTTTRDRLETLSSQ